MEAQRKNGSPLGPGLLTFRGRLRKTRRERCRAGLADVRGLLENYSTITRWKQPGAAGSEPAEGAWRDGRLKKFPEACRMTQAAVVR